MIIIIDSDQNHREAVATRMTNGPVWIRVLWGGVFQHCLAGWNGFVSCEVADAFHECGYYTAERKKNSSGHQHVAETVSASGKIIIIIIMFIYWKTELQKEREIKRQRRLPSICSFTRW